MTAKCFMLFYGDDKMFSFISINITWVDLISANAVGSSCCHILLLRNHVDVVEIFWGSFIQFLVKIKTNF